MQHTHRQPRPLQKTQTRTAVRRRQLLIAQRRHHLIRHPLPQPAILRVMVMHQHRVQPRLTEQQLTRHPVMRRQRHDTTLISIQLARRALIQRPADHAADIAGAEPDLGFEEEGAQLAVVA